MPKKKAHIRALAALLGKTTKCKDCGYFDEMWPCYYMCKLSAQRVKKEKTCRYFTFEVQNEKA